jgi:hypothetical protein
VNPIPVKIPAPSCTKAVFIGLRGIEAHPERNIEVCPKGQRNTREDRK